MTDINTELGRRRFMAYMAGGLALGGSIAVTAAERLPDPMVWNPRRSDSLIASPADAMNVFDFEAVAYTNVPPAHFGYMASGIDDEVSLRANRSGFDHFYLRPRRLVDVSKVNMGISLLGDTYASPIVLAPVGGLLAYHSDGELGTAAAAKNADHLMILSTMTSTPIEDVARARGRPLWFQLYPTNDLAISKALISHAERAGCTAMAVTVDRSGGRNQETFFRMRKMDSRQCSACHTSPDGPRKPNGREEPMFSDIDLSHLPSIQASALNWDRLSRIRDATKMKCVIKGILTPEDAKIAVAAGYDAIIVSNHGGRADEAGFSPIEALPDVVAEVRGKIPVIVDSGFRRGTDIVKALALGANAVAIGRPYLWGLGAFGQAGVERVLELLRIELLAAMQQIGAPDVKSIQSAMIAKRI